MEKQYTELTMEEVKQVVNELVSELNRDNELPRILMNWSRLLVFRPKTSGKYDPVYLLADQGTLRVCEEPVDGFKSVEIAATPNSMVQICLGEKSLVKAFSKGEIKAVNGSLADLLRMKALLDRLRTIAKSRVKS